MRLRFRVRPPGGDAAAECAVEVEPADGVVTFGRGTGVLVPLPFPAVSALHARVFAGPEGLSIVDEKSVNGTFLHGRRLPPGVAHSLSPGDVLRLADVTVVIDGSAPDAAQDPSVMGTGTLARRLVGDLFRGARAAEVPRLIVEGGPAAGCVLELTDLGRTYRLGRAPDVDLAIPDDDISREHVAIERSWNGVQVRDLGSKNGIRVGGAIVIGTHRLRDGEVLQLGRTPIRLDDPEDRYLRQMEEEAQPGGAPSVALAALPALPAPPGSPPRRASGPGVVAIGAALLLGAILALAIWLAV